MQIFKKAPYEKIILYWSNLILWHDKKQGERDRSFCKILDNIPLEKERKTKKRKKKKERKKRKKIRKWRERKSAKEEITIW